LLLDKHEAIVQRLRAGEPVDAIAQSLHVAGQDTEEPGDAEDDDEEAGDSKEGILQDQTSTSAPLSSADGASASEAVSDTDTTPVINNIVKQFDASRFDFTTFTTDAAIELLPWLTTAESPAVPGFPFPSMRGASRRHSFGASDLSLRPPTFGSSTWTKVTLNRALVRHLIGLFFSWEFPPFTMVSQELFLRDYHSGGRQFCSPALVNAIASVATRYMEPDKMTSTGDAHLLGEQFFSESKGLLVLDAQIPNLPSIQAFALLAMREMSCGRELEAQELCLQAVRLLSALDFEDLEGHGQLTDHLTVRCMTFAGVLSLTR
jgi:hypothetical protein